MSRRVFFLVLTILWLSACTTTQPVRPNEAANDVTTGRLPAGASVNAGAYLWFGDWEQNSTLNPIHFSSLTQKGLEIAAKTSNHEIVKCLIKPPSSINSNWSPLDILNLIAQHSENSKGRLVLFCGYARQGRAESGYKLSVELTEMENLGVQTYPANY